MNAKYFVRFEDSDNFSDFDYTPFATKDEAKAHAEKVLRREIDIALAMLMGWPQDAEIFRVEDNQIEHVADGALTRLVTDPIIIWEEVDDQ